MAVVENKTENQLADEQFIKEKEAAFLEFIQTKGLKTTRQRGTIVQVFFGMHGHISVEELLREVKQVNPRIGYATVYRTLHLLVESGLVEERRFGDGLARYEGRHEVEHHDHMICLECGRIREFSNPRLLELQNKLAEESGFKILRHRLELYGVCEDPKTCQQSQQSQKSQQRQANG
ncbi:MAG: transcriptional repressor [Candidatus Krumholzibacteria bacterium]|jgi:Fur family ferric uptake transcriptional regulator|nr:transcriptional repressor [Candidatus Krumholzibacteria bacterium]